MGENVPEEQIEPTEQEVQEQQERFMAEKMKDVKLEMAWRLYPAILTGVSANPNVPDRIAARMAIGLLKDALAEFETYQIEVLKG